MMETLSIGLLTEQTDGCHIAVSLPVDMAVDESCLSRDMRASIGDRVRAQRRGFSSALALYILGVGFRYQTLRF